MNKTATYWAGFDAMQQKIQSIGWAACRDMFNLENPPGQKWDGSQDGFEYAKGEFDAICEASRSSQV